MAKRVIVFVVVLFMCLFLWGEAFREGGVLAMLFGIGVASFVAYQVGRSGDAAPDETNKHVDPNAEHLIAQIEALSPEQKVRGVFESIHWEHPRQIQDSLFAREVSVVGGKLCLRGEANPATWEEAATKKMSPNSILKLAVPLDDIETIEMQDHTQYVGLIMEQQTLYLKNIHAFQKRHPHAQSGKGQKLLERVVWYNPRNDLYVFAYTREGDRHLLFRTYSRDHAIKWRKQVAIRIEEARASADQAAPTDGAQDHNSDYL